MDKNKDRRWCVYMHTSPSNKKYIGITSQNPNKRWENGNGYLRKRDGVKYDQPAIAHAIIKYPDWKHQWKHEILFNNLCEKDAKNIEQILIAKYRTTDPNFGYNITCGGDGHVGHSLSQETRQKIGESVKKNMTSEVIERKREAALCRPAVSEETRRKMSESHSGDKHPLWGKHHSEETKEKMRRAMIGKNVGQNHPRARSVYCYELNEVFGSLMDVENKYGFNHSNIAACCRGKTKSAGKHPVTGEPLHWKYIDEINLERR